MSRARAVTLHAARTRARARAAIVTLNPGPIAEGAPAGVLIAPIVVSGWDGPIRYERTDSLGGLVKIEGGQFVTGATPTAGQTSLALSAKVFLDDIEHVISGTAPVIPVEVPPLRSPFVIPALGKVKIAAGGLLDSFLSVPDGNLISVTSSANSPVELTISDTYVSGSAVVPPPSAPYTGLENSGWQAWTEDGAARTLAPEFSEAQGNGTGALGDQVRTTAKPMLHLVRAWRDTFSGKYVLAFDADAKAAITKVRVYVEGAYLDITSRKWWHYVDPNGKEQWFYGFICEVDAQNYIAFATNRTRGIHVRARAYAADGTMQTQLMGHSPADVFQQWKFFPRPVGQEFDVRIEIRPSAVANSKPNNPYPGVHAIFKSVEDAFRYCAGQTVSGFAIGVGNETKAVACYVMEDCALTPQNQTTSGGSGSTSLEYGSGRGYFKFFAGPGVSSVTFGRAGPWDSAERVTGLSNSDWRTGYYGCWWEGEAFYFDYDFFGGFNFKSGSSQWRHAWNGVRAGFSWNPLTQVDDFGSTRTGATAHFMMNCPSLVGTGGQNLFLSLNNVRPIGPPSDLYNGTNIVYGDRLGAYSSIAHVTALPGIAISYTGGGATPQVVKTGAEGATSSLSLRADGAVIADGTLAITSLRLQAVVDWINTTHGGSGWAAAKLASNRTDDRAAKFITPGTKSLVSGGAAVTFTTAIKLHFDFWQGVGGHINKICRSVRVYGGGHIQSIFLDGACYDMMFSDLWFEQDPGTNQANMQNYLKSHVVFRGFTDPAITVNFENSEVGGAGGTWATGNIDRFCEWSDGVAARGYWAIPASATAYPVIEDSHFCTPSSLAQGAQVPVNISSGGSPATLYPGAAATSDARPAGLLLDPANLVAHRSPVDAQGIDRGALSPKGATARGLPNGLITKAQALKLAAVSANDVTGEGVGAVSFSWKSGPGETGSTLVTSFAFDVAA